MRGSQTRFTDGSSTSLGRRRHLSRPIVLTLAALAGAAIPVVAVVVVMSTQDAPTDLTQTNLAPAQSAPPADGADETQPPAVANTDQAMPDEHDAAPQAIAEATTGAADFVDAWLLRGHPADRHRALSPVTTPPLLQTLTDTDINALPNATRTAQPTVVASGPYEIAFHVPLSDGTAVEVVMIDDGTAGWRASEVRPLDQL